jgi:glycosyltransferase involved in cell wall biosynthesis
MKFTIITHAEHKLSKQGIFAYEPYVREMNLWLKYVNEVKIVAPISNESITSIESIYKFDKRQLEEDKRHPELISGSHGIKKNDELLKQVQHDVEEKRHSEHSEAIPSKEQKFSLGISNDELEQNRQIATSHTLRNGEIQLIKIPSFDITSFKNVVKAILKIPSICYQIYKAMQWADHIHLRCPGNVGLLGCFVQILFPKKPKTVKYAGNWDPNSKQPLSYRLQKWLISNIFLTRNVKVLVYGDWKNQSKNIVPFFTASYSENEIEFVESNRNPELDTGSYDEKKQITSSCTPRNDDRKRQSEHSEAISSKEQNRQIATSPTPRNYKTNRHSQLDWNSDKTKLKFIFVGGLTSGKQPLLTVKVIHQLKNKGYNVQLDMYGDGIERINLADYILDNLLEDVVFLHGNASKEIVKKAYQKAHFLVFISKSEGWPKVLAEAMFWGCVPLTSDVSCVSEMLGNGSRGTIVKPAVDKIILAIESYLNDKKKYAEHAQNAMNWSQQFTLERFEKEIRNLLCSSQKRI